MDSDSGARATTPNAEVPTLSLPKPSRHNLPSGGKMRFVVLSQLNGRKSKLFINAACTTTMLALNGGSVHSSVRFGIQPGTNGNTAMLLSPPPPPHHHHHRTHQTLSQRLDDSIRQEYLSGEIPNTPTLSTLLSIPLSTLLAKPLRYRKHWFHCVETARRAALTTPLPTTTNYHPERKAIRHWLQTGRITLPSI